MKIISSLGRITMPLPSVKRVITIIMLAIICMPANSLLAQTGCEIPYEFILRNQMNVLVKDSSMTVKISVIESSASGTVVYQETHTSTSSPYGTVSLVIGEGTIISGDFTIPWSENDYYVQTKVDLGSGNFIDFGTEKLVGLPCQVVVPSSESLITMDMSNHQSIQGNDNDMVNVVEPITISDFYYSIFQSKNNIQVSGGSFIGSTGTETIKFGSNAIFHSVTFQNIKIDANDATFINCIFINNIDFPNDATIEKGLMNNVVSEDYPDILSISGMEIYGSTLKEVERIINCRISNSIIGQPTSTTISDQFKVKIFSNNDVDDSTIYSSKIISGNHFDKTLLDISETARVSIFGNIFKNLPSGFSYPININLPELVSNAIININGNTFEGPGGTSFSRFIYLSGTNVNKSLINISDNICYDATYLVSQSETYNALLKITNNVLRESAIGPSNNSANGQIIIDNYIFN